MSGGSDEGLFRSCLLSGWRDVNEPKAGKTWCERIMMRLELAELLIEKRGLADEWKRSRR